MATHPTHIHRKPKTIRSAAAAWLAVVVTSLALAYAAAAVYWKQSPETLPLFLLLAMVWLASLIRLANTPRRRRRHRVAAAVRRLLARGEPWPLRHHAAMTAICAFALVIVMGITWGVL
jgi:hypothetical protein